MNNLLYGIFLKYFNENYQRTLIHEMRIPSDSVYEAAVSLDTALYRLLTSKSNFFALSHVKEELVHHTANICRSSNIKTRYLPILWKEKFINNEDIRYTLLDCLIASYSNATDSDVETVMPVEKLEDLTLDELIRKNEFYLRIDLQIKRIEKQIQKEDKVSWGTSIISIVENDLKEIGKRIKKEGTTDDWADTIQKVVNLFLFSEKTTTNLAKSVNELALKRFFYVPKEIYQSNSGLKYKRATLEDIKIDNCIQKLNNTPLLQKKFKHIYDNIHGMNDLKTQLFFKVLCPIFDNSYVENYNLFPPNGVLFYGPPGCGKSLIAKTLADATESTFIDYSPGSHGSKYQNETSKIIQDIFHKAEMDFRLLDKRTVIFVDEADSVFPRREQLSSEYGEKSDAVEQFLRNMESCSKKGILVICATNFKNKLDPAAVRDGRIDLQFEISPPSANTRRELFKNNLKDVKYIDEKVDLDQLVHLTDGFPPASIKAIMHHAANIAAEGNNKVDMDHFKKSIGIVANKLDANKY